MRGGVGAAGANPHRQRVGEGGLSESGRAEQEGGNRGAECPVGHQFPPGILLIIVLFFGKASSSSDEKSFSHPS
jgi:hypothetical protein